MVEGEPAPNSAFLVANLIRARDFAHINVMLQPDFDPVPTAVRIYRCKYVSQCKARSCPKRETLIAEKVDVAGRHVRQVELCALHCEIVVERERVRGLEICDRRSE